MNKTDVGADTKSEIFERKIFHDGKSSKDYESCKKWSNRRWAWEFLCRNTDFKEASDVAINGSTEDMALVAKKYGLVRFKYYAEVQTKKAGYPTFKNGAIKSWENIGSEKYEETIKVYPGQVVIRFKLTAESNVQQSIDEQMKKASTKLKKKTDEFLKIQDKKFGTKNPKANLFSEYLRILDMKAQNLNETEILEQLNELPVDSVANKSNIKTLDNMKRDAYRYIKTANECAQELYKYIALRPDKKKHC